MTRVFPFVRSLVAASAAVGLGLGISACSSDPNSVAEQAKSGDNKGYVEGDGTFRVIAPDQRKAPVELSGTTLDGDTLAVQDHRGEVVVVNTWASWCGPCEEEAPHLVSAYERYEAKGDPVAFVGINFRETSVETGRAQAKAWKQPYPSIFDKSGTTAIDMQGVLTAQPTTAVLDREGRIAGVILGAAKESILTGMIDDVLAEGPAAG